jgi:putative endonuclease
MAASAWILYVLECRDGTYYCGITTDLERRVEQHQRGTGARYTRGRGPVRLVRQWSHSTHSEALKAEAAFKRLSRVNKEGVLRSPVGAR